MAPELAAGQMEQVLLEAWNLAESELHSLPILQGTGPLLEVEHARLSEDFFAAKAHLMTMIQVKLQHWSRLPYILCGLAVSNEEQARGVATAVISEWEKDHGEHSDAPARLWSHRTGKVLP